MYYNKKLISNNDINTIITNMELNKTMRYLGNKTDYLEFIDSIVNEYKIKNQLNAIIFDGFGGTGCVTQHFNKNGFNVIYLGANVPLNSIQQISKTKKIDNLLFFAIVYLSFSFLNSTIIPSKFLK